MAAQRESVGLTESGHRELNHDVYLLNGYRITVCALETASTNEVLEKACAAIDLPAQFAYHFALVLMRKEAKGGQVSMVRKLMDFEAPHLTQVHRHPDCKIVIRKSYWDSCYDTELMAHKVALNLLYIQTVSDVERGWTLVESAALREELTSLQARGNKKEYLDIARQLPSYGLAAFRNCTVDYPERGTGAVVTIGNKEICFRTADNQPHSPETKFRVTRIRCWKITTIHNVREMIELSFGAIE